MLSLMDRAMMLSILCISMAFGSRIWRAIESRPRRSDLAWANGPLAAGRTLFGLGRLLVAKVGGAPGSLRPKAIPLRG
jgi:hypothetical protein